jgi:hypothetical protein
MYPVELLLAAGVLALTLVGRREHLTFTSTLKDIRESADPAELDRIFALAPDSLQRRATALNAAMKNTEDLSKTYVAKIVQEFQTKVYVPATAPITESVVDNFVAEQKSSYQAAPTSLLTAFFLEAYSTGDAKRLLVSYLDLKPAAAPLAVASIPSSSTEMSIPSALEQMRDMLLEYKVTGKSEYKSAYEGTKAWLDRYIADLNVQLTRESDAISAEVTAYQSANPDMTQTQAEFQRVVKEGPELENRYLTLKKQMDQTTTPDTTGLYVKGVIAAGLALGAAVLSFV